MSSDGRAVVRPLIGIAAAVVLIVCFFLPWLTRSAYASLSLNDMASKSSGQGGLTIFLLVGGAILAAAGSGLRAAGNAGGSKSQSTTVTWVVGFGLSLAGFAVICRNQFQL